MNLKWFKWATSQAGSSKNLGEDETQQAGWFFNSSPPNYLRKQRKIKGQLLSYLLKKIPTQPLKIKKKKQKLKIL